MNAHIPHPHTAAAIQALEAAQAMEDEMQKVRDFARAFMQLGTFDDVVMDPRDRMMFLMLTRFLDDTLDRLGALRTTIVGACHGAKYGAGKMAA